MTTVGKVVRRGWALFALPTVLCFAVFFVVPLAMGIYLSFTSFRTGRILVVVATPEV